MSFLSGCLGSQFKCDDGLCIETTRRCDRVQDCSSGEDESKCREANKILWQAVVWAYGLWINVSTFSYVDCDLNIYSTPLHSLVNRSENVNKPASLSLAACVTPDFLCSDNSTCVEEYKVCDGKRVE